MSWDGRNPMFDGWGELVPMYTIFKCVWPFIYCMFIFLLMIIFIRGSARSCRAWWCQATKASRGSRDSPASFAG